jgi:hypothetical protein
MTFPLEEVPRTPLPKIKVDCPGSVGSDAFNHKPIRSRGDIIFKRFEPWDIMTPASEKGDSCAKKY